MAEIWYSFRETTAFTRRLLKLLDDDEYAILQEELTEYPEQGKIIKGSGGIRKIRWSLEGRGKRGGARVIYYFAVANEEIFMLDIYAKNERADLSSDEIKELRETVRAWLEK